MKRCIAFLLTVLTVLTMLPAVTLSSAAAETIQIGKYGTGAETWRQSSGGQYRHHTQFLLTMQSGDWAKIENAEGVTVTQTSYDKDNGKWIIGGVTGARFLLTVNDLDGEPKVIDCPPSTVGSSGNTKILRFETADYGKPALQITNGNVYAISLEIYIGDAAEPTYVTNTVEGLYWEPGKASEGSDKMYVDGKPLPNVPVYIPANDPYKTPVEVEYYHYATFDFEAHPTYGKNLLLGISQSDIPAGGNTGVNAIEGTDVKAVIGGKTYESRAETSFTAGGRSDSGREEACFFIRIPFEAFPDEGEYEDCLIEIYRPADGQLMFTGKISLTSEGDIMNITGMLGKYGDGAETWKNHAGAPDYSEGGYITQFLLTVPNDLHNLLVAGGRFTEHSFEDGKFHPAKWEGIDFRLTISCDGRRTTQVVVNPASIASSGNRKIYRFETCEAGYEIRKNEIYSMKVEIFVDGELRYRGSIGGLFWSNLGDSYESNFIYYGGVAQPDEDVAGIEDFYHYSLHDNDFEGHESLGKNLLLGIPYAKLPNAASLIPDGTDVTVTVGDSVYKAFVASNFGSHVGFNLGGRENAGIDCYFVRIRINTFPDEGTYKDCSVVFKNAGGFVVYSGTVTLMSKGDVSIGGLPEDYPQVVTLSDYTGSSNGKKLSDWVTYEGENLLHLQINGLLDQMDLWYYLTEVTAVIDDRTVTDALHSVVDLAQTAEEKETGRYHSLIRLDVGSVTPGWHKVQLTVRYDGDLLYTTEEFQVFYSDGVSLLGDVNGDGKVNAADRTALARALAGWSGYTASPVTADLNGDGNVNAADRTYLARYLAGWNGYTI